MFAYIHKNIFMSDTLVIIPTYNEKDNIEAIIKAVFKQKKSFHILVVDDNSPDGTSAIVNKQKENYPDQLFLKIRKGKNGLGKAYISGFEWALKKDYQYIIQMDADFSHNPKDLIRLYNSCANEGFDLSIGSRYVKNRVNVINWDIKRLLLSFFASRYVKFITRIPIYDTTAGFVCWNKKALEKINFEKIKFIGYAFQIEMKFKAWKHKLKLNEVSVVFKDRSVGKSKMSGGIIYEALFGVIKMKINGLPK